MKNVVDIGHINRLTRHKNKPFHLEFFSSEHFSHGTSLQVLLRYDDINFDVTAFQKIPIYSTISCISKVKKKCQRLPHPSVLTLVYSIFYITSPQCLHPTMIDFLYSLLKILLCAQCIALTAQPVNFRSTRCLIIIIWNLKVF